MSSYFSVLVQHHFVPKASEEAIKSVFFAMFQFERTYTSWTVERIARHVIYWCAWLLFYATVNSSYTDFSFVKWSSVELLIMSIKLPFTYFVIYVLVPRYLIKKRYLWFILIGFVAAMVGGVLVGELYNQIIKPIIFGQVSPRSGKSIFYLVLDLIYVASLPTVFKLLQKQVAQEKKNLQLVEQKLGAELQILKNQLHPHFLFNTLNNLYGMVLTKHPKAADVVVRLSDMMSYMLYECERDRIVLDKEIQNLHNYIELEKIRYGKRLDISFETGGVTNNQVIAPLLFMPFIENAFKHGVENSEKQSWVRINLWLENDELQLIVENSLPDSPANELSKTQSGIGLMNVRKRLELIYTGNYQLDIKEEDSFLVQLNVKLAD